VVFVTIECVGDNFSFIVDNTEHDVVDCAWPIQVVNVHEVLLANTVGTVLSLLHNTRRPCQLCEDYR